MAVTTALFLLVVLPLALVCLYRIRLSGQVGAKLEAIRQSGYPVTLAELDKWYPEVSRNENAATVLTNAFALIVAGDPNSPTLPLIGKAKWPVRGEPLSAEMKQAIEAHLALNRQAINLLHQGAQLKKCRYPVEFSLGIYTLMPHLVKLKESCELMSLEAALQADRNNLDGAVNSVVDSLALASSPQKEPAMISSLVRIACQSITQKGLERILNHIKFSDEQLSRLFSAVEQAEESTNWDAAFAGELCLGFHAFTLPIQRIENVGSNNPSADEHPMAEQIGVRTGEIFLSLSGQRDKDRLYYLGALEELLRISKLRFPERLARVPELKARFQSEPKEKTFIISALLLPNLYKSILKDARNIAGLRSTQTEREIERFRLAHSSARPESARDLVPSFLKAVPLDPCDGKPLRYRRLDTGYVVYSIADDGKDGGGAEFESSKDSSGSASRRGSYDWTFIVER